LPKYKFDGYKLSVAGLFVDNIGDIAPSTSISTGNFRRGWNARNSLDSPRQRHVAVVELVRTLRTWIEIWANDDRHQTVYISSEKFYITLLQDIFSYNTETERAFQTWIHILTADPSELERLHHEVQSRADYGPVVRDYVRLFGCSPDPKEWPEDLIRRLVVRVYSVAVSRLQHDISLKTYHRTFFTTHEGLLGVGPRWVQPTDHIVVFAGKTVPYVVKNVGEHYCLVGPAYIYGMMEDEKWDDAKVQMITLV
jgi:hypothetical protein